MKLVRHPCVVHLYQGAQIFTSSWSIIHVVIGELFIELRII